VATVLLMLLIPRIVYGSTPSAIDLYIQIINLHPGADVKVAYDLLGSPHSKTGRIGNMPPCLQWNLATHRTIAIFLRDDSAIELCSYVERYEQIEAARQRYEELKESFDNILVGPPEEYENSVAWLVGDFAFGLELDYSEKFFTFGKPRSSVRIHYLDPSKFRNRRQEQ
jgi:hypothetical protein